jgi:AcrR family transcriptional regulator
MNIFIPFSIFIYISSIKQSILLKKSERTTKYIIETVAPIFNAKGYTATSMNDITSATGLTKGAIYGNFKNKEELAIAAFNKNINDLLVSITLHQKKGNTPLKKLLLILDFYRDYYDYSQQLGGCPILNVGVDAIGQETDLIINVRNVIEKTQANIAKLVDLGKREGELDQYIHSMNFAKKLYSRIQGAVFMMYVMNDPNYMKSAMDDLESMIKTELSNN